MGFYRLKEAANKEGAARASTCWAADRSCPRRCWRKNCSTKNMAWRPTSGARPVINCSIATREQTARWNLLHTQRRGPRAANSASLTSPRRLRRTPAPTVAVSDYVKAIPRNDRPLGAGALSRAGDRRLRPQRVTRRAARFLRDRRALHHLGGPDATGRRGPPSNAPNSPKRSSGWNSIPISSIRL